jgi:hypothetical protein
VPEVTRVVKKQMMWDMETYKMESVASMSGVEEEEKVGSAKS